MALIARVFTVLAAAVILFAGLSADAPHIYAIRGARIVTAAGAPLASGTIVLRGGVIAAVGTNVEVPGEARVIDGAGATVYPGLIDMGSTAVVSAPENRQLQNPRTREELERWKRSVILNPQLLAAEHVRTDATEVMRLSAAGITTVLATPRGEVISGHSALMNVVAPADEPQIGAVADPRQGLVILKTPVALHVSFPERAPGGDPYPNSLMGVIAFVRQAFLDAQHYSAATARHEKVKLAAPRPTYDPSYLAMQPAALGRLPVALEANSMREILRAMRLARELKLQPIITGGREADRVAADLVAAKAPVLLSLNYPTRPRTLAPDAQESVRALRERANAPRTATALEKAGVLFAFQSDGLREGREFVRNAGRAVKEGLASDAAVRALTINAARIAGVAERVGSLERGKIANLIITDGDLFEEKTRIRHVFIDGRLVPHESFTAPPREGERPGRPGNDMDDR